ncbi:MAG: multidrug efflux pump subunit AcrB [Limisphaerales bacterium]|jgi:multidrug efflux pump subunit AcrB
MRGIIKFFINHTIAANLLMVFILIAGIFGLLQLKTTFFPETPLKLITIQLVYPGASPEEMEEGVVSKIEENMVGVTGVKRTSSVSSENAASVSVELDKGFDIDLVLQDVKNAIDQISSFPLNMEPPTIFKVEDVAEAYIFSITGTDDLRALKEIARKVEDDLLALDGISKVKIDGFPEEEIEISFREADMRAMNITFEEAVGAVSQTNLLTTGGTIKTPGEELLIRAKNKNYYAAELEDIVIRSSTSGGLIRLHQIADVKDKWEDAPNRSYVNGEEAVIITVYSTRNEDMFGNSAAAKEYLVSFSQEYPNFKATEVRDGKKYLNGRIEFIKKNGLIGFFLVVILLAMFLNWRIALWVALAIPISFAGMFVMAVYAGISINVITTFGMIIVIGILVDDGIVIAENIYQHFERGKTPIDAAIDGTMEVLPAVSSAILTTVIAFSAFFFIDGFLGEAFSEMSVVVIATIVFSLIEGMLILPAHIAHSKALKAGNGNRVTRFFDSVMETLKTKIYGPFLKLSMRYPLPTLATCVAAFMIIIGALQGGLIKGTFFPNVQADNFEVNLELPAGTSEDQVFALLSKIEEASWKVNQQIREDELGGELDVITVIQKDIGPDSYQGKLTFYLLDGELRPEIDNRRITTAIKKELGPMPEADKLVFGLGNIFGDPVSISLLSTNTEQLNSAIKDLKSELQNITDLTDISDSNKEGLKEVSLTLKPKAYNLGLSLGEIIGSVRQGFFGAEIQRLQRGSDEVKVWVRYKLDDRQSMADLANMRIRTADGLAIPLSELVSFSTARGVVSISHIDGEREVRVTADVSTNDASVSDINSDIQSEILPKVLARHPLVKVGIEGQARDNAETMASIQKVMPLILLGMFFVITLTFSSVTQALIVMLLLPFGFIGVGLGHWLLGQPISFLSVLGIIALVGIFVNDALVFISTFNLKIKGGAKFEIALYETGLSRFRPILLTTITTVAGLLPLLLEKSVQAQFLIPMAISVAFGLIVGTFILLVLIPALLTLSNQIKLAGLNLWTGTKNDPISVEPANPAREQHLALTFIFALLTLGGIIALVYFSLFITGLIF